MNIKLMNNYLQLIGNWTNLLLLYKSINVFDKGHTYANGKITSSISVNPYINFYFFQAHQSHLTSIVQA